MTIIKINNNAIDLNAAEIPSLDTAKIATGTFPADRINNTSLDNITSLPSGVGGTAWQAVKTSAFTAVSGQGYFVDTTSGAITVTLPASASAGDTISIVDYAGTFNTNNITLGANGLKIESSTDNKVLTTNREGVTITYVDATQGWVASSGVNSGDQALDPAPYSVDFLVIAGGAGGGRNNAGGGYIGGGGGGAGGYRNSFSTESSGGGGSSETSLSFSAGTVYTVTVGAGGAGQTTSYNPGANGVNSSISGTGITTITSTGGGGGGSVDTGTQNGSAGGSGGGAGGNASSTGGAGTANQGYAGGNQTGNTSTGGGGGASAVGQSISSGLTGGNGGAGLSSSITGSSVARGGGGGAGSYTGAGGTASNGGGAGGAGGSNPGIVGTVNTGGGGGGGGGSSSPSTGATGGSGVVILRMPTDNYSGTVTGAETPIVDGSDTILIFNASGSYTG